MPSLFSMEAGSLGSADRQSKVNSHAKRVNITLSTLNYLRGISGLVRDELLRSGEDWIVEPEQPARPVLQSALSDFVMIREPELPVHPAIFPADGLVDGDRGVATLDPD